jgi:hypothetical protein
MSTISFYTKGVLNAIPGQILESDATNITFLNPLGTPLYASTDVALTNFPANTSVPFVYVNNLNGVTVSGTVVVDATPSGDEILAQLYPILPRHVQVAFNSTTSIFTFTSTIAGADGAFTLTVNTTTIANTVNPGAATTLKVGRIVVPVTTNNDLSVPANDSTRRYRYPVITDTANTLAQAVVVVLSTATNYTRNGGRDTQLIIVPGSTAPGMSKGLICMYPITALTPASTLLVETNTVNDTVGRITGTATATTLALPAGKIFVESGTVSPNRPAAIRL